MKDLVVTEKPLVLSILIITAISVLLYIPQPNEHGVVPSLSTTDLILKFFYSFVSSAYVLITIRLIRGKIKNSTKPPYIESELNIGDYIWRFFAVGWVASFSLIATVFIPIDTPFGKTVFTVLILILVPIITLILFGKNRMDKIKKLIMLLSGMPRA